MSGVAAVSSTWIWVHIVVLAIVTYALRVSFIALFSYFEIPESVESNLKLVPPAVLAALAMPPFLFREGSYHLSPTDPFVLAGIVALGVAWKSENLVLTILAGFAAYFGGVYLPLSIG